MWGQPCQVSGSVINERLIDVWRSSSCMRSNSSITCNLVALPLAYVGMSEQALR